MCSWELEDLYALQLLSSSCAWLMHISIIRDTADTDVLQLGKVGQENHFQVQLPGESWEAIHASVLPAIALPARGWSGISSSAFIQPSFCWCGKGWCYICSELQGEKRKKLWFFWRFSAAGMELNDFLCLSLLLYAAETITATSEPLSARVPPGTQLTCSLVPQQCWTIV